ncbi:MULTISPECIES: zinc-dependent alcohol dehydrogenase family protein [Anaerotruncus]|uniref:zinc-dependent alcohol dehydrogenase family protein n=1 Tax=Anaerotruncus TaxID=244127 RepID=UPI000E549546|nr:MULTISPECIES: zinc-dependent alcohol dehydrogenase family protein [Anaerotruncus]RGX54955.1 hypothetical protein DWV16_11215 [Anaerotruncus sp. AF02-27]
MKAIVLEAPRRSVAVADKPMPEIGPDEVLIQVQACGICATDLKMFKGEYSGCLPVTPGHEFTGRAVKVGDKVTRIKAGDRVVADPNESCGACGACRTAHSTFCETMAGYGVYTDGGLAEYAKAKEKGLYLVPENLPPEIAAFVEPISCALHGIEQAGIRQGDNVVIIGAGTMGQLLLQMARNTGAAKLIHVDRIAWKLEVSKAYGATDVVDGSKADPIEAVKALTGGKGADVVIEAVGHPSVLEMAMDMVAQGGRIVQFGFPAEGVKAQIEPFQILKKELTLVGSWINPYTYERALHMLSSGKLRVDHLVTHLLKLEDYEKAIHLIETQPQGFMKSIIMVHPE